jgi:hypothetical protein
VSGYITLFGGYTRHATFSKITPKQGACLLYPSVSIQMPTITPENIDDVVDKIIVLIENQILHSVLIKQAIKEAQYMHHIMCSQIQLMRLSCDVS